MGETVERVATGWLRTEVEVTDWTQVSVGLVYGDLGPNAPSYALPRPDESFALEGREPVLMELAHELRKDESFGPMVLDDPELLGVDAFADSAIVIRFLFKTRPLDRWTVKRELLRRIKLRFDELGIEIPFPHRTVYHRDLELGPGGSGESGATNAERSPKC